MERFDVAIVGGGPAGTTAGYLLSRSGLKTAVIERSSFPRRKLCGGGLTNKAAALLRRIFNETEDSLREAGIVNYSSKGYDIYFQDRLMACGSSSYPILFVDRYDYDFYLAQKAKSAGAFLIEGEKVKRFDPQTNVITTANDCNLQARFVIGADGVHSVIRSSLPGSRFSEKRWEANTATALEAYIPRSAFNADITRPIIFFGYSDWGYSWIFPNKNEMIVGLGALSRKNKGKIKTQFRDFINAVVFTHGLDVPEDIRITGHPVPCGNYLKRPAYNTTVLVGDAAGFADPLSGEGIFQAHRSAEIAAISILRSMESNTPLEQVYIGLLKRYLYPDLLHAKILRWFVFRAMNSLDFDKIRMLTRLGEKRAIDIVHGLRTYRFLARADGLHGEIV